MRLSSAETTSAPGSILVQSAAVRAQVQEVVDAVSNCLASGTYIDAVHQSGLHFATCSCLATFSLGRRQLTNLQRNFQRSFEGWHRQKLVA